MQVTAGQTLYSSTYLEDSKQEAERWLPEVEGEGKMRMLVGMEFDFEIMGKLWRHMMVIQLCKGAYCHSTGHLKMIKKVNFIVSMVEV